MIGREVIVRRYADAGFSLIEVLVALVILGVGLMGLARLQLYLLAGTAETAAYDQAVRLASDRVEALRMTRLSGGVPSSGSDELSLQGMRYWRTWSVNCTTSALCESTLVIQWAPPRGGGQQSPRELSMAVWLAPSFASEQLWMVESGPPHRETLP